SVDTIHSGSVCTPRGPHVKCGLLYYFNQANPDGSIPQVSIQTIQETFDTVPEFVDDLGNTSMPYSASIYVTPKTPTSSYFALTLLKDGGEFAYTNAEVSMTQLAKPGSVGVHAPLLRMAVPAFAYQGVTY